MINYKKYSECPDLVKSFCQCFDAFIVGGAAKFLTDEKDSCKDWDIIVPLSKWGQAQKMIPKNATHNTYGGSKIITKDYVIDVWSCDLNEFLSNNIENNIVIINPKTLYTGKFEKGFIK